MHSSARSVHAPTPCAWQGISQFSGQRRNGRTDVRRAGTSQPSSLRARVVAYGVLSRAAVPLFAISLLGAAGTAGSIAQQRADLAVRVDRVLDVQTGRYSGPTGVLISDSRISALVPAARFHARDATRLVDLGDLTLVPGLINAHVHLGIGGMVRANALADVRAGFTTVADQGARTLRPAAAYAVPNTVEI